jgi:VIT1/CCC1 family predicted Fe2+/Mn2+ transporter
MTRLRILQAFEVLLVFALLFGIVAEFRNPQWPNLIGFAVNILWQYMTLSAIRRQKNIAQLAPSEQSAAMNQQRALLKPLFIGGFSLFGVLLISVGLFLTHAYSIKTFAFVSVIASALAFCFLVFSLTRLQKRQR